MIGYVVSHKPELKIKEFEMYRGYYCGICKSVARRYGQLPRLALSYDFAFLAVLLSSLAEVPEGSENVEGQRCIIHPVRKIAVVTESDFVDYSADVMLLLMYFNLLDDKEDEHKIRGIVGSTVLHGKAKALMKKYTPLTEVIKEQLAKLKSIEKEKNPSPDMAGDAFAEIMAEVFAGRAVQGLLEGVAESGVCNAGNTTAGASPSGVCNADNTTAGASPSDVCNADNTTAGASPSTSDIQNTLNGVPPKAAANARGGCADGESTNVQLRILGYLGRNLGRWIYLADAMDDIEDDIKSGNYNPMLLRFAYDSSKEDAAAFHKRIEAQADMILMNCLAEVERAYSLLDIGRNRGILDNIIYFGLLKKTEMLLNK